MTWYTADSRDRVRDAVDMLALVESKVELRRAGVNSYFGRCPFHDENTPSFHVRPDEKHYHCFGCSESGDPFDFVMQTEGLDFRQALESLADRFGVTLQAEEEAPEVAAERARRERLYGLLGRAATYYERQLWESAEARGAREYLVGRGFTEQTLRDFRVGYAPDSWERIVRSSRGAGFADEELLAVGLAQPRRGRADQLLDRFRGRIMFPASDARGRVRGFGARILANGGPQPGPKYLNTSDGPLYHKREVLYGISLARPAAAKAGRMVLAEGYTDVIALHQAGIRNAVGIMGTSLTKEQVGELVRLVSVLELCLDADRAGQDAIVRAAELCAESKLELRVVPLPSGADPGDLIASEGAQALCERVAASVPYVVFEVERILERADLDSAEGKDRAIAELRRPLAPLGHSVLRDELVHRSAGALALSEARLTTLLAEGRRVPFRGRGAAGPDPGRTALPATQTATVLDHEVRGERSFLAMCVAAPTPGELALAAIDPDVHLTSGVLRRAARHLAGRLAAPLSELPAGDEELARVVAELVARAGRGGRVGADQLEHARLLLELGRIERELARATAPAAAPAPGHGIVDLARRRQEVREAIGSVVSRIERFA